MEDESQNFEIVLNASQFIYAFEVGLAIILTCGFIYLERFKNFEKFNIDMNSRDYMLKLLTIMQSICMTYVLSFLFGFFGNSGGLIHSGTNLDVYDCIISIICTFIVVLVIGLLNLQVSNEGDLLRRILTSIGKKIGKQLAYLGHLN